MHPRTALITGGTRGIGYAIAERYAREGVALGLIYARDHAAAERAVAALRALGARVHAEAVDVADPVKTASAAQALEQALGGRFNILVNNAGAIDDALLMFQKPEQIERLLSVHLAGAIQLTRHCLKAMIAQKGGVVVNVISPAAYRGRPGQTVYAAAKGGLLAFTKTLTQEVGPLGIRVNALCPGVIETDLVAALRPEVVRDLLSRIPMQRLGSAREVAAAAWLLTTATYMSGSVLNVDGGLT